MAIKHPFQTVFPIIYCLHHIYVSCSKHLIPFQISSRASVLSIDFLVIYIQRTSPWCSRCSLPSLYSPQPTTSSCLEVRKHLSSRGATIKVTNKKHLKKDSIIKREPLRQKRKSFCWLLWYLHHHHHTVVAVEVDDTGSASFIKTWDMNHGLDRYLMKSARWQESSWIFNYSSLSSNQYTAQQPNNRDYI